MPSELPVMVLPRSILFPQALLPLHIFEKRYCKMLKDILPKHRIFCIGTIRPNKRGEDDDEKEGIYDVLGVGLVRAAVDRTDGTTDLIVQGLCRARVLHFSKVKPYYKALIRPLASFGGDNVEADALSAKLTELVKVRAKLGTELPENVLKLLTSLQDPEALSDLVSFSLLDNCHDKQKILETLDLRARLRKVIILLQKEIERLQFFYKIQSEPPPENLNLN